MKAYVEILTKGRSWQWPKLRRKFIEKNFCCEACCTDKNLEVHHIVPFSIDPKLELKESNLITLCKYCHLVLGHFRDYELYNHMVVKDAREFMFRRMEAVTREKNRKESR